MSSSEIQKLMEKLSFMHEKFQNVNYNLSALDIESLKKVITDLHTECLTYRQQSITPPAPTIPSPPAEATPIPPSPKQNVEEVSNNILPENSEVEAINEEINGVFEPPKPTPPPVAQPKELPKEEPRAEVNINSILGINDQIMFANELYGGSKPAMVNILRKMAGMGSLEKAQKHFDEVVEPFFTQEQKDPEVVHEFRAVLERLF